MVKRMDEFSGGDLPEEYAALGDRAQVMAEVVTLVEQIRVANKKLGDAFVSAGLPGREWRDPDCALAPLSDSLPDVTLDELLTRLAEFAAGTGPHWLHGGIAEIARFNDEASILCETVRALRILAQRQRMLPARQRGDLPILRALGDVRIGTQLDRMTAALRDLEALAPFIAPVAPEDWAQPPLASELEPAPAPARRRKAAPAPPAAAGFASAFAPSAPPTSLTPQVMPGVSVRNAPPAVPSPAPRPRNISRRVTAAMIGMATQARAMSERLEPRKWLVVAATVVVLAAATGVLGLLVHEQSSALSTSNLVVSPTHLALTCTGKSASANLALRDTATTPLTWTAQSSGDLTLSATHGTLKQGASATLSIKVRTARAAQGTLTFTSAQGNTDVAYTISCGK
jgi:hypothetical protein